MRRRPGERGRRAPASRVVGLGVGLALIAAGVWWFGFRESLHPERYDIRIVRYSIDSSLTHGERRQIALVPEAAVPRAALLVLLHGRGMGIDGALSDELLAALEAQGRKAPIVVIPDGGESSYWHDRESGEWASYLLDEVIPIARDRFDVDHSRVGIGGISMGGFGALNLSTYPEPEICAIGAHSPAIWTRASDAAEGAFDDADDFLHNDVYARLPSAAGEGKRLWIDIGDEDPFRDTVRQLAGRMARTEFHEYAGGHDDSYWRAHMDDYMRFYAERLWLCAGRTTGKAES
jgi:enterochelin esterase-like enzyme